MTYREKLKLEHPTCINPDVKGGCEQCPCDYGYENDQFCPRYSNGLIMTCTDCWDREIMSSNIENRLKHLLSSKFIASFDEINPVLGKYKRDISEADEIAEQANSMVTIRLHPYCNDCPHFGPKMDINNMHAFNEKKITTCVVSCKNYLVCEYMHDMTKGEEK